MAGVLVKNGVFQEGELPTAPVFLKSSPPGVYTTTRTGGEGTLVLFWQRHLQRLRQSLKIVAERGLCRALELEGRRDRAEEFAITAAVTAGDPLDVHIHISKYNPLDVHSEARLAVVGPGRELPSAKSSEWVRRREALEKFRSPSVTEFLLSNDGDNLLEGSVTNFFVVRCQENKKQAFENEIDQTTPQTWSNYLVQTAPLPDGVLPGIIRQVVIEICAEHGIPLQEVTPSLSTCSSWKEAFITNSLRLVQSVESIEAPSPWSQIFSATNREEIAWKAVQFEVSGKITQFLQQLVMSRATTEGYRW